MKISYTLVLLLALFVSQAFSQKKAHIKKYKKLTSGLTIIQMPNILQGITNILFGGCVNISNLTYSGSPLQIGYFVDHSGTLGIDSGIVLTTGRIDSLPGHNTTLSNGTGTNGGEFLNGPGDSQLTTISGNPTYDAAVIEFDFSPQSDTLVGSRFIFGSEEYIEYVGSSFNDVYGFFISGPGITGSQNIALVPGTSTPITVNNINTTSNSQYYNDNLNGNLMKIDGYTSPFSLYYNLTPYSIYHFKIAIADAFDGSYNTAVFIKGGSFLGNEPLPYANFTYQDLGGNVSQFTNVSTGADTYSWDFDDGQTSNLVNPSHSYSTPGAYNVRLTTQNYCYSLDTVIQVMIGVTTSINGEFEKYNFLRTNWIDNQVLNMNFNLNSKEDMLIEILTIKGDKVFTKHISIDRSYEENVNLSNISSGSYILRCKSKIYNKSIFLFKN